ncbi:MAG TPA: FecR family protein [Polyangia bacterium]|nr:FecR family protein [Polyangia bacterium]
MDREVEREQQLEALGDVVAETIPTPAPGAAGLLPDEVARVLMRPRRKLRVVWKLAPVLALGAAAAVFTVFRAQPLRYELSGSYAAREDVVETPGDGTATARFSDGTSIAVGKDSAARIRTRTRTGATIRLERGRASFAVVHRPGAQWNVEVGPFEIAVTGTEFDVHWSDDRDGFEVVMKSGTVVVRGSLTGEGISLHAGQRLVASLANKTLVVSEAAHAEAPAPATAPARVVVPQDPPAAPRQRHRRTVAQAAPALMLHDVPERPADPGESAARKHSLSPPTFEPAPAPTPPAPTPPPPAPAIGSFLEMGGANCNERPLPQIRFEHASEGFRVLAGDTSSVLRNPVIDHTTSWCGGGSLRLDASFDVSDQASQSGEAIIFLPHPVDLRGRTVTIRFMARAPFEAEFSARILAGQGDKRTGNSYNPHLTTGSWWTISNTFHEPPTTFGSVPGNLQYADRIILKVDATGSFRVWSGPIYIDDIGWR